MQTINICSYHASLGGFNSNLFGSKMRTLFHRAAREPVVIANDDNFANNEKKNNPNEKFIVFINHPFDMILSAYEHHKTTGETYWAHREYRELDLCVYEKLKNFTNLDREFEEFKGTYQNMMLSLGTERDMIIFEMLNSSKHTCQSFLSDYSCYKDAENYLFIRLESLRTTGAAKNLANTIVTFLNIPSHQHEFENFLTSFCDFYQIKTNLFAEKFEKIHFDIFEQENCRDFLSLVDYS